MIFLLNYLVISLVFLSFSQVTNKINVLHLFKLATCSYANNSSSSYSLARTVLFLDVMVWYVNFTSVYIVIVHIQSKCYLEPRLSNLMGVLGFTSVMVKMMWRWQHLLHHTDTMMKFASFDTIVEMIYKHVIPKPKEQCSKPLQLAVSFAGGYVAGVFCAVISHPADNLVSFLNNAKGATVTDVSPIHHLPCFSPLLIISSSRE